MLRYGETTVNFKMVHKTFGLCALLPHIKVKSSLSMKRIYKNLETEQ